MRKIAALLAVALAVPAAAVAGHKTGHTKPAAPAPKVQYVVKGTVSAYTASTSTVPGKIKLKITGGNSAAKRLFTVGSEHEFTLATTVKVVSASGIAAGTPGDRVIVKVKAAKNADAPIVRTGPAWQVVETS